MNAGRWLSARGHLADVLSQRGTPRWLWPVMPRGWSSAENGRGRLYHRWWEGGQGDPVRARSREREEKGLALGAQTSGPQDQRAHSKKVRARVLCEAALSNINWSSSPPPQNDLGQAKSLSVGKLRLLSHFGLGISAHFVHNPPCPFALLTIEVRISEKTMVVISRLGST